MFRMNLTLRGTTSKEMAEIAPMLRAAAENAAKASALVMTGYTIRSKFEDKNPPYLNRRTGNAIRTIASSPRITGVESHGDTYKVTASYGTDKNAPYVKVHEEGGDFTQSVPAHTRRSRSGGSHPVRAHQRRVHYRARHMFRDAIREMHPTIKALHARAFRIVLRERRVPTVQELAASAA